MPWGWECRAKLIKQRPAKPTVRRGLVSAEASTPGPQRYEAPEIFCGKGFSKIKRAPAYTFGHLTPISYEKPVAKPTAPIFNVQGFSRSGRYRITHSVVSPRIEPVRDKGKVPGPGAYAPQTQLRYKRPPAYTMQPAAKPPYEPWDMWTPSANMYWPPIPGKKTPAFTMGNVARTLKSPEMPAPGQYEPKFDLVEKTKPAFSLGGPYRCIKPAKIPAPNTYCEKKFMVSKRTIPAPSFGIRHSRYIGKQSEYLKSSKLDLLTKAGS